jgi:hypothetical protein
VKVFYLIEEVCTPARDRIEEVPDVPEVNQHLLGASLKIGKPPELNPLQIIQDPNTILKLREVLSESQQ